MFCGVEGALMHETCSTLCLWVEYNPNDVAAIGKAIASFLNFCEHKVISCFSTPKIRLLLRIFQVLILQGVRPKSLAGW